ncbi:four helix bundle protein [Candidatus Binatia bacterium]|nr:four helix bundle protein [Candidatus Binatia bacterium]
MKLDHERLDVYQVSLEFAAWSYELARGLKSVDRHSRDQLLRASQSIALNIAEGCGKVLSPERRRYLQIAGGSARECGAILDILQRCGPIAGPQWKSGKELLVRIVAMLTRMTDHCADRVREEVAVYEYVNEYEYGGDADSAASADGGAERYIAGDGEDLLL